MIYSLFVGAALVFRLFDTDESRRGAYLLYILIGSYALTIFYALILRRIRYGFRPLGYFQLTFDLLITAALVALTGGIGSFFSVLYLLTVISASILMDRKDAFVILAIAVVIIVFQVSSEVFGQLGSINQPPTKPYWTFYCGHHQYLRRIPRHLTHWLSYSTADRC